ncbi:MAG: DUF4258 domain-containing protein [Planctomycetota bacterium]
MPIVRTGGTGEADRDAPCRLMFERAHWRMRNLIRRGRYVMTIHGFAEMVDDDLTLAEIEYCVLMGTIVERQRDRETREWKYLVRRRLASEAVVTVLKFGAPDMLVIITTYREER